MKLILGDCVEKMRELDDASIDAVVCDPPYGLEFMGKAWDSFGKDTSHGYREKPRITDRPARDGSLSAYVGAGGKGINHFQAGPPYQRWCQEWAAEALRVLKPGGHLLAFGGTRTYHRLACAIEDAGFEIRDCLAWMYGSGFPKSANVAKAIDRVDGAEGKQGSLKRGGERLMVQAPGGVRGGEGRWGDESGRDPYTYEPGSEAAQQWQGWGTALKPAHEPVLYATKPAHESIVLARKPPDGTVAANVLEHGTGALNIDATRIAAVGDNLARENKTGDNGWKNSSGGPNSAALDPSSPAALGRWPANVLFTHHPGCQQVGTRRVRTGTAYEPDGKQMERSIYGTTDTLGREVGYADADGMETIEAWDCVEDCPVRMLDEQSGERKAGGKVQGSEPSRTGDNGIYNAYGRVENAPYEDSGGASRFFYVAKASRSERNAGLGGFEKSDGVRTPMAGRGQGGLKCRVCGRWKASGSPCRCPEPDFEQVEFDRPATANQHPTVKPIEVMRWLVRLVTPPGGRVLDPFLGSGTTGIAASLEGCDFIGIEREPEYLAIAEARIKFWTEHGEQALEIVAVRERAEAEREQRAASGQLDLFAGLV